MARETKNLGGRPLAEGEERKPFMVRLSASDRERVDDIREHEGLNTDSDTVRHCIRKTHEDLEEFPG